MRFMCLCVSARAIVFTVFARTFGGLIVCGKWNESGSLPNRQCKPITCSSDSHFFQRSALFER